MRVRLKFRWMFWFVILMAVLIGASLVAGREGLDLQSQKWGPGPEMEKAREVYSGWFCFMPIGWIVIALLMYLLGRSCG